MWALLFENGPLFLSVATGLGLLVGSFLNVVIIRVPRRMEHDWKLQCESLLDIEPAEPAAPPAGIVQGRSFCPHCKTKIKAVDNIPVISFLLLRGQCSTCRQPISIRYPVTEAFTGFLFFIVAWHFGPGTQCVAAMIMTSLLIAMSGIDLDHQLLPDSLTLPLLWLGLILSLHSLFISAPEAILGAAVGYLFLWTVYHLFKLVTGKEGMGYGDFKLLAALGAWLGWQQLPLVVFISSLLGAITGLTLILIRRHERGKPLPFGPFIAGAGWVAFLWGRDIINAYFEFSGL